MTRDNPEFGSQDNEDAVLAALLPAEFGLGSYMDIGAHHPTNCSNTWQFYCRGWRGVLVEPLIDCWPELLKQRIGDILVPVAASNSNYQGTLRVQGSISSLEDNWPNHSLRRDVVPTMTVMEIINKLGISYLPPLLCSIDVEGHEKQVLEGIDFQKFRPWVYCVEYLGYTENNEGGDLSEAWEPILLKNKYVLVGTTRLNKIYVSKEYCKIKGSTDRIVTATSAAEA